MLNQIHLAESGSSSVNTEISDASRALCEPYRDAYGIRTIWRKTKHTFLQARFLYPLVMTHARHQKILDADKHRGPMDIVQRLLEKALWFWPRAIEARHWAAGKPGDRYTPTNFLAVDKQATILLDHVECMIDEKSAAILDLGCNAGRHLNALHERGYTNLHGVDVMASALSLMRDQFPQTYAAADVKHDLFQRYLAKQSDQRFDALYTHGATIELVHPSFDLVGNMARVTKSVIALLINELAPDYYQRFWVYEFERHGFHLLKCIRPVQPEEHAVNDPVIRHSLFVFVRVSGRLAGR